MGDALRDADVKQELKMLFDALADRLPHARAKHDWPTTDTDYWAQFYALDALAGEFKELVAAVSDHEGRAREKDEALDCIAVLVRFWLGDHLPEGEK